jgi:hypothetical protein
MQKSVFSAWGITGNQQLHFASSYPHPALKAKTRNLQRHSDKPTYQEVADKVDLRPLGNMSVKVKAKQLAVY